MLGGKGSKGPPFASNGSKTLIQKYTELLNVARRQEEILKQQGSEIKQIIDAWQSCFRSLDRERLDNINLRQANNDLETDIMDLRSEVASLMSALQDAKSESAAKTKENGDLGDELRQSQSRLHVIRNIMQSHFPVLSEEDKEKLGFLASGPSKNVLAGPNYQANACREADDDTVDDNDYDESVESQDILGDYSRPSRSTKLPSSRRSRRRSTSVQPQMTKRDRSVYMTEISEENDNLPNKRFHGGAACRVPQDCCNRKKSDALANIKRSLNRSMSANDIIGEKASFGIEDMVAQNQIRGISSADLRTPLRPHSTATWIRNGTIEKRRHSFAKLSKTFKITTCAVCYGSINIVGRPAQKCKDCHQHVHTQCTGRLGIPCIPRLEHSLKTPSKTRNGTTLYKLQNYCPNSSPMIASPIVHCVTELEKRGLIQEGLYRVPGKKNTVTNVLHDFRTSRNIPKLDIVDIEVVADVIKQFLRELRDPLIPKTSRDEFIKAAISDKLAALNTAIYDLPQANRDTLAYLILHWQRVAAECQMNKMPIENVARCVALAVMGQSSYGASDMGTAARETGDRERVLTLLLSIDAQYWQRYLFNDLCGLAPSAIPSSIGSGRPTSTKNTSKAATLQQRRDDSTKFHSSADYSLLGPISSSNIPDQVPKPVKPDRFFPQPY